LKEKRRNTY